MSNSEDPDLTGEADAILGRADAFMRRRRPAPEHGHLDDDIPLLTDILPLGAIQAVPRTALDEFADPAVFQRSHRGPDTEPAPEPESEPAADPLLEMDLLPEPPLQTPPEAPDTPLAPSFVPDTPLAPNTTPLPDPANIEELVAERLREALVEHRQEMAIALDDWLNFDLPRLVSREIDGIADRIVKKAGEELRILLQPELPPAE